MLMWLQKECVGENDTLTNCVNSGEVSDHPKNGEVSGSGSKDAIPGGLEEKLNHNNKREIILMKQQKKRKHTENMKYQKLMLIVEKWIQSKNGEVDGGGSKDWNKERNKWKWEDWWRVWSWIDGEYEGGWGRGFAKGHACDDYDPS